MCALPATRRQLPPPWSRPFTSMNPDLPLFNETTLKDNMRMGNVFERIAVVFAGSFGLLALVLASVGIYGVVCLHHASAHP